MRLLDAISRRLARPSETLEGYEQPELVDVIFRKTAAYQPRGDWINIAGASTVLDFGGGCGLHYKQARSDNVRWAVVETVAMVERAKELATERLKFFTDISEAAAWLGDIDVMHSDGAIQYTPDPEQSLAELCRMGAKEMVWKRVPFSTGDGKEQDPQTSFLSANGPGPLRGVKERRVLYTITKLPEPDFLAAHSGYLLSERGSERLDGSIYHWFRFKGPAGGSCR